MEERDRYTISVIRQDFSNQLGHPPDDDVEMLLVYMARRAALRAKHRIVDPRYGNPDVRIEHLLLQLAA